MSSKQVLLQAAVKHVLLIIVLLTLQPSIMDGLGRMSKDQVALGLVLIVSSLLIAGAVSGFFSFRYEADFKSPAERGPFWHLMIGHLTTAGLLFVIGTLMTVMIGGLNAIHTSVEAPPYFGWLAVILYMSLVFYDIYDLGRKIQAS
jgi:hypothetical protein